MSAVGSKQDWQELWRSQASPWQWGLEDQGIQQDEIHEV
jgi:hypothetical protein